MKNKMAKKLKRKMKKSNVNHFLMEMADDFKDLISNAKKYKGMKKRK